MIVHLTTSTCVGDDADERLTTLGVTEWKLRRGRRRMFPQWQISCIRLQNGEALSQDTDARRPDAAFNLQPDHKAQTLASTNETETPSLPKATF